MRKLVDTACQPGASAAAFAENSSSVSCSSESALPAPRMSRMPATRNSTATRMWTGVSGSRLIRPPNSTATTVCTRNAATTPIHTSSGR